MTSVKLGLIFANGRNQVETVILLYLNKLIYIFIYFYQYCSIPVLAVHIYTPLVTLSLHTSSGLEILIIFFIFFTYVL